MSSKSRQCLEALQSNLPFCVATTFLQTTIKTTYTPSTAKKEHAHAHVYSSRMQHPAQYSTNVNVLQVTHYCNTHTFLKHSTELSLLCCTPAHRQPQALNFTAP
jgi:hypothetical protein